MDFYRNNLKLSATIISALVRIRHEILLVSKTFHFKSVGSNVSDKERKKEGKLKLRRPLSLVDFN